MNHKIERYSKLYALTYKRLGVPMRFIVPFMNYIEKKANDELDLNKDFYSSTPLREGKEIKNVVVSLTSFPARVDSVWKTIASLKSQTFLPKKIILWLSREEFPDEKVPEVLSKMQDDRFEIRFVDDNLRSHKKYYYAFGEFKDSSIITVDDDMYYHKDTIKSLIETSSSYPGSIIANWVIRIGKEADCLKPYLSWKYDKVHKLDRDLFPIGVSGILYPPGSLDPLWKDKELFMKLTPWADDIWLNATARLNNTPVVFTGWKYRNIPTAYQTDSLTNINCDGGLNDRQLKDVRNFFKGELGIDIYLDKEIRPSKS